MITQCPHCQTLFHISEEQLHLADGLARCCRCHEVFNAQQSLRNVPLRRSMDAIAEDEDTTAANRSPAIVDNLPEQPGDSGAEPKTTAVDIDTDAVITETGNRAIGQDEITPVLQELTTHLQEELSEEPVLTTDIQGEFIIDDAPLEGMTATDDSKRIVSPPSDKTATDIEALYPDLIEEKDLDEHDEPDSETVGLHQPAGDQAQEVQLEELLGQRPAKPKRSAAARLFWGLSSLLLLAALALQLAWIERARLIHYPEGRQLLELLCKQAGCTVPLRRDIGKIEVLSRDVRTHPDYADALLVKLAIISTTPFTQPYPQIQILLFNTEEKLIASRVFQPQEYLPDESSAKELMPANQEIPVQLELVDPGQEVTGFKLEFL